MDIEANDRREKMLKLRDEFLAIEEDRLQGRNGCTLGELDSYLNSVIVKVHNDIWHEKERVNEHQNTNITLRCTPLRPFRKRRLFIFAKEMFLPTHTVKKSLHTEPVKGITINNAENALPFDSGNITEYKTWLFFDELSSILATQMPCRSHRSGA